MGVYFTYQRHLSINRINCMYASTPEDPAMKKFGWVRLRSRKSVPLQKLIVNHKADHLNDSPTQSTYQSNLATKDYSKLLNPLQYEQPGVI